MKFVIFVFSFTVLGAYSSCIKDPEAHVKKLNYGGEVFSEKIEKHLIVYGKDSCGARGCEVYSYTKALPNCWVESFRGKGFYMAQSLDDLAFRMRINGKFKTYRFDYSGTKFE